MTNDELVTIATFDSAIEANRCKSLLEEEGFACNLKGEIIHSIYPVSAPFEIELQVAAPDQKPAQEFINKIR